jgi:hypothetical protein
MNIMLACLTKALLVFLLTGDLGLSTGSWSNVTPGIESVKVRVIEDNFREWMNDSMVTSKPIRIHGDLGP